MSEHLYPCRIRTDPLAICDCKANPMTPTASDECRKEFEKEFDPWGETMISMDSMAWSGYQKAWRRCAPAEQ